MHFGFPRGEAVRPRGQAWYRQKHWTCRMTLRCYAPKPEGRNIFGETETERYHAFSKAHVTSILEKQGAWSSPASVGPVFPALCLFKGERRCRLTLMQKPNAGLEWASLTVLISTPWSATVKVMELDQVWQQLSPLCGKESGALTFFFEVTILRCFTVKTLMWLFGWSLVKVMGPCEVLTCRVFGHPYARIYLACPLRTEQVKLG